MRINKIKYFIFILLGVLYYIKVNAVDVEPGYIMKNIAPGVDTAIVVGDDVGTGGIDKVIYYVRDFIFNMLIVIAVGVFLFIGYKLISARGNAEEFKKAWMALFYAVIGLVAVPLAWGAINLIAGLKF